MADTLPALLAAHAERTPNGIALRQKRLGIWQEVTWRTYWQAVQATATGLVRLGVRRGDVVALIGGHRVQWLESELGVMAAGAIAAPIFPEATSAELADLLANCEARLAIVEGQAQVDRLLAIRDRLPHLEQVVYWDPRGMRDYRDPWLRPLWEVTGHPAPSRLYLATPAATTGEGGGTGSGQADDATSPVPLMSGERLAEEEVVAAILHTPGTGGPPRAIRLTHANLIAAARAFVEAEGIDAQAELVSFAPNAWIGDRAFATAAALVAGYTVNLPEEPETVPDDIREIGPRLMIAPPLAWQRLEAAARTRAEGSGRLRRSLFHRTLDDGRPGVVGRLLIANPVRDHLGLLRVRHAYNTGAPLPETTARFFRALGVPIRQIYTLTAAGGPVAIGDHALKALPGAEIQIGEGGEVLVRGPGVASAERAAERDGWLRTGDLGCAEADGAILLVDRVADLARLADGTEIAPMEIEQRLTGSPYVRHAVAIAEGRPYVAALIEIDGPTVSAWAERRGTTVTTYRELSAHPAVHDLVRAVVHEANTSLPAGRRVQRFALLDRELSVEQGELTRLRTIRRAAVLAHWSRLIDALYGTASAEGAAVITVDERTAAGAR